jgi:hypothetical protein
VLPAPPITLVGADGDGKFSAEFEAELHPTVAIARTTKAASAATFALTAPSYMITAPRILK